MKVKHLKESQAPCSKTFGLNNNGSRFTLVSLLQCLVSIKTSLVWIYVYVAAMRITYVAVACNGLYYTNSHAEFESLYPIVCILDNVLLNNITAIL